MVSDPLDPQVAAARERWPSGPAPDAALHVQVAAQPQRGEDLYLAWWAGTGDPAAIAAFEAAFDDDLRAVTARFKELPADELRQHLRIKLFVGTSKSPPKIRDYAGSGSLRSWLRVTAVRSFVDLVRAARARRDLALDDAELIALATPGHHVMRAELAAQVKAAFAAAVAGLEARQRVFLRHAYLDHDTLDQIAARYAVHRTTVARTLAAARTQLIAGTRAALAGALGVDAEDLASAIRMLDSQIDLSLSRVLTA